MIRTTLIRPVCGWRGAVAAARVSLVHAQQLQQYSTAASTVDLSFATVEPKSGVASKPTVLFIHGLMGSRTNFRSFARHPDMHKDRKTVCVDLRNHGDSPHAASMTIDDMTQDVAQLIRKQNLGPCVIVGHSLGGKVAMGLALVAPELVHRLIVVDIVPIRYTDDISGWIEAQNTVLAATKLDLSKVRGYKDAEREMEPLIPNLAVRQFICANLVPTRVNDQEQWVWRINLPGIVNNLSNIALFYPPPPAPVKLDLQPIFLFGDRSDYAGPKSRGSIAQYFADADLIDVPNAGHWVHADQPAKFLELLLRYSH